MSVLCMENEWKILIVIIRVCVLFNILDYYSVCVYFLIFGLLGW